MPPFSIRDNNRAQVLTANSCHLIFYPNHKPEIPRLNKEEPKQEETVIVPVQALQSPDVMLLLIS